MTTKDFIKKLNGSDEELLKKLSDCKLPEDAYQVACGYGVTDEQGVFTKEMTKLNQVVGSMREEDLSTTMVGSTASDVSTIVTGSTAVAATAAGAAATCF